MGLIATLLERRVSIENPAVSLNSEEAFDLLGSSATTAGVRVNAESALTLDTLWRGLNILCFDTAILPLDVFRIEDNGDTTVERGHRSRPLVRRRANAWLRSLHFKALMVCHALLHGDGMAWIQRDGQGRPLAEYPLEPRTTEIELRRDGRKVFHARRIPGVTESPRTLNDRDVFHLMGLSGDGVGGIGVIRKARESLGVGLAARKFGAAFFGNGSRPSGIIEMDGNPPKQTIEEFREQWGRQQGGLENAWRIAVLKMGAKWKQIGLSPQEVEFLATRKFSVREVANWLGLPPHFLGDETRTSHNSLVEENASYLRSSLDRWLVGYEEECDAKHLTVSEFERETHRHEFDRAKLLRMDPLSRFRKHALARQWSLQTIDEIRREENLDAVGGEFGGSLLHPSNMVAVGTDGDGNVIMMPAGGGEGERGRGGVRRRSIERLLRGTLERMVKRIGVHAGRAAKRPERFVEWLDRELAADHRDVVAEALDGVLCVAGRYDADDVAADFVTAVGGELLEASGRASAAGLGDEVATTCERLRTEFVAELAGELLGAEDATS